MARGSPRSTGSCARPTSCSPGGRWWSPATACAGAAWRGGARGGGGRGAWSGGGPRGGRGGRGAADQPGGRGRPPRRGHGHELRQPGAVRRVPGQAGPDAGEEGVRGAPRDRPRDRPAQAGVHGRPDRRAHAGARSVPRVLDPRDVDRPPGRFRGEAMARTVPPAIFWLAFAVFVFALLAPVVPLYTDWLWFHEVGYAQVFLAILSLRGSLVIGVGLAVFVVLYANLAFAARTAPPDVLWELEDQL